MTSSAARPAVSSNRKCPDNKASSLGHFLLVSGSVIEDSLPRILRLGRLGLLLVCLASAAYADVDGTNYTEAVRDQPGCPEGLLWVGTNAASDNESASLWNIVTNLSHPSWPDQVEGFFETYPSSPWAASLHHAYAAFCRRTGRTTKALEHWETGWALASTNSGHASHKVGGMILASWTDQLSSLGRIEKLGELVPTGRTWPFANHQDLERFEGAENSYYLMQMHPEIAFRCGTLALKAVGQALQPGNAALEDLPDAGSPTNGFSLADLASLGQQRGVSLAAVRREAGTELVVPSVIHWQQNHYAAIVAQDETNGFLVVDPTFGRPLWLPADVINEEASGAFLIASGSRPVGWTELSGGEAAAVHGQGLPNTVKDGKDKGCKNGAAKKDCPCAKGMPVWWVSEPYVNLWMADEPISYLTSRGEPFTFRLSYKQRDTRPDDSGSRGPDPGLAPGWNHPWFAYAPG